MMGGLAVLSKPYIATVAVFLLGGDAGFVEKEDVALKAQELAPGRFGWQRHQDWIDLEAVACALRDAKKPRMGGLLLSNGRTGWMLTPAGLDTMVRLQGEFGAVCPELLSHWQAMADKNNAERERMRLTRAFRLYTNGEIEQLAVDDYHEFAKVNEYFGKRTRSRRLAYVANVVHGDEQLEAFWNYLLSRFGGKPDDKDQRD